MATAVDVSNRGSGDLARAAPSSSRSLTDRLISIREAEEIYGVSGARLYPLVRSAQLPAVRLDGGGRWSRIRLAQRDVQRLAEQLAEQRERQVEHDRRAIEAAMAWEAHASARGPRREGALSGRTRDRLAEMFHVAPTAVDRARSVVLRDRSLAEAARRGERSLAEAARILRERAA